MRDALCVAGVGCATVLTFFVISSGFDASSEAGRSVRLDISAPLGKLTSIGKYWDMYTRLLLSQQGYGEAMFQNIPCDWGPIAGLGDLPVNEAPEVPLYLIPTDFLAFFGYASQLAALQAMGVVNKMMCLEQVNGTLCDCNLEVSYPKPEQFVKQHVFQGNEFKYYDKTVFSSVWLDEDGYVLDSNGEDKIPQCASNKNKRLSLSKSYTITFSNHYMNIYVCVDKEYEPSTRFAFHANLFIALTVILGSIAVAFAIIVQRISAGNSVVPATNKLAVDA